jgi:hypothetical protein
VASSNPLKQFQTPKISYKRESDSKHESTFITVRDTAQKNVMNTQRKSVYSFLSLIILKNTTAISTRQTFI